MFAIKRLADAGLGSETVRLTMDYHLEDFPGLTNIKPILRALKLGLQNSNQEFCGIFVFQNGYTDYDFVEFNNLNTISQDFFSIDNKLFDQHYLQNNIISLYHTHIVDSEQPSNLDIEISESLGLPSFIHSLKSKNSYLYYPESYIPRPLESRIFIPFFQDCISFVKDYFKLKLNISLQNKIKNWARKREDSNDFLLEILDLHFTEVNINDKKENDLIVFKPHFSNLFHVSIYVGNNYIYHHPITSYPKRELFTQNSLDKVYKVYRYKDL